MNKRDYYEQNIVKKCDICGQVVITDMYGNGTCEHCGWEQDESATENPDKVIYPNLVSFNRGKKLIKENKKLTPSFEEFIEGLYCYKEMQFYYKNKLYGVLWLQDSIDFYEYNIIESLGLYKTIEEFAAKANINGVLLKDIWDKTENAGYMTH